ncbi:adhesion G-protein coupled receptor G2 [Athalia rosae]|uniref:adhesion G-protein coupled receptor G2 n=1 Tax=Athalia rosae TaxID=37344 RepID=UPI002033BEC5|nr:adhesion G-protein coupled receptor G2 [Athalia rosae]
MGADRKTLKQSQILNSTDVLLDSLNNLLDYTAVNTSRDSFSEEGLISIVTPRLIIHISDPNVTGITGLALVKNSGDGTTDTNTFIDYNIVSLTADHTIEHVANLGEVEVATWIPRNLSDVMRMPNYTNFSTNVSRENSTIDETPRIVVTLFYDDFIFTNELVGLNDQVDSRVVSVSVPGYGANLPFPIPLLFRPLKGASQRTKTCAFWDFDYVGISTVASESAWSDEGCVNSGRARDLSGELNVCLCSHLTHFAQLLFGYFPGPEEAGDPVSIRHGEALEVITVVGCVLSMIGVFGILVTAMVFKSWRNRPGNKVLIQLSLALGLEKIVIGILPIVDSINYPIPCMISGAILHYAVLAEFSWMLVTAWLQFKRYVTVLGVTRPPRFLLKAAAFAWGIPLTIVSIVASIDPYIYLPSVDSNVTFCQVSGIARYVAFLAPITLIISSNIVLFVCVIRSIFGTRQMATRFSDDKDLVIAQLRLAILLFFLLGITGVFGLVAQMGGGLVFSYLFCVTATLQGFVLFMFFIIIDPTTRNRWYSLLRMGGKFSNKVSPNVSATSDLSKYSQRY